MKKTYRKLNDREIAVLTGNRCSAEDWNRVEVSEGFTPETIRNCAFRGTVKIGDHVTISHIHDCIANYVIGDGVVIKNTESLITRGESAFGNGTRVAVLNENGGREVPIYDRLSAQIAYVVAMYRHLPDTVHSVEALIEKYTDSVRSPLGGIGAGSRIMNCGALIDLRVGENCTINGASELRNGTVDSSAEAPTLIGRNVIARDFIVSTSAEVTDGANLERCFVGQGCRIGKGFSAESSLFFANCVCMNGEACAAFAGPYTVSHHKATLMIGGMFSFYNAGSGSNMSNHMYRLGPVHQGILERGTKTASSSYLLFPARIGAFSIVKGRHNTHPDTSALPFSYLIESRDESIVIPGANLGSVGSARDAMKWPQRDLRQGKTYDLINFKLLNPYTAHKIVQGIRTLVSLSSLTNKEYINYHNVKIKTSSVRRGFDTYRYALDKYIGGALAGKLRNSDWKTENDVRKLIDMGSRANYGEWIDAAGLIMPMGVMRRILGRVNQMDGIDRMQEAFGYVHRYYHEFEWVYVVRLMAARLEKPADKITVRDLITTLERWKTGVERIDRMLCEDAKKEYAPDKRIGYGIDGDEKTAESDFEHVRGKWEADPYLPDTAGHTRKKEANADELIARLSALPRG